MRPRGKLAFVLFAAPSAAACGTLTTSEPDGGSGDAGSDATSDTTVVTDAGTDAPAADANCAPARCPAVGDLFDVEAVEAGVVLLRSRADCTLYRCKPGFHNDAGTYPCLAPPAGRTAEVCSTGTCKSDAATFGVQDEGQCSSGGACTYDPCVIVP